MNKLSEALIVGLYFALLGFITKKTVAIPDTIEQVVFIFFITGVITYYASIHIRPSLYPMFNS